jgi:RNA polymerase sigma-70 factor, ECF subfamily
MNVIPVQLPDNPGPRADDATLLQRIGQGDREAMRQLYYAYFRRVMRFLSRTVRDPRLAEEIVNDTMMVVWQHAADFRAESRPSTWILGIAYRRALKSLDRAGVVDRHDREAERSASVLHDADVDTLVAAAERDDWLQAGLATLSLEHRMALEMAYFVGLSSEEIAEVTGCPVGTVKTRVFYARLQLRTALQGLATPNTVDGKRGSS